MGVEEFDVDALVEGEVAAARDAGEGGEAGFDAEEEWAAAFVEFEFVREDGARAD